MKRFIIAACTLAACAAATGCAEDLTLEDTPPRIVAMGPLEFADARTVLVNYNITDLERDDAALEALVCVADVCTPAVQGDGGDGLDRVPTIPPTPDAESAARVFAWDVACSSVDPATGDFLPLDVTTEFEIGLRVLGSDAEATRSPATTLESLGYTSGDASGIVTPCQED
jgi:hypothetical protein